MKKSSKQIVKKVHAWAVVNIKPINIADGSALKGQESIWGEHGWGAMEIHSRKEECDKATQATPGNIDEVTRGAVAIVPCTITYKLPAPKNTK